MANDELTPRANVRMGDARKGTMPLALLLAGALVGAILGRSLDAAVAGAFAGFVAGYVLESRRKPASAAIPGIDPVDALLEPLIAQRIHVMERRIAALETALREARGDARRPETIAPAPADERAAPHPPSRDSSNAATQPTRRDPSVAVTQPPPRNPSVAAVPAYARPPSTSATSAQSERGTIWRLIAGGNTLARTGVVVLFIGVAFLLEYATQHMTIPIAVRLAGVALGGIVLLILGWRLRTRRAGYAMTLQGAGVGILYLTVFAALRLYQVLPAPIAFALLLGIGALSSVLAIRQDAMALAVLGILGGFAAPLLASSGGSHVTLFSYYAALNAAVLAIAWFKAWRLLNILGFACTVVVATLWGVSTYRPEDLPTTEPFVILFFLFYVAIATLYALRRSLELRRYVDATLVFGAPLVAAGWQDALVHGVQYALAGSAVAASVIYGLLARLLIASGPDLRLLVEAFAALAIVFATLAIPLALDARLTSATWALEGAALVFMGVRQAHLSARVFGLLLQFAAGIAFALGFSPWTGHATDGNLPVVNSDCLGAVLIACGGLASSRVLARASVVGAWERAFAPVVFAWGVAWWLGAGWHDIHRFVAADTRMAVLVVFLAGSAALFAAIAATLAWPLARVPALALPAALVAIACVEVVRQTAVDGHLLGHGGVIAWPLALAIEVLLLRHFEHALPPSNARAIDAGHASVVWVVTLIVAQEIAWLARTSLRGLDWPLVPWGLSPALMLMAIAALTARASWPFRTRAGFYLRDAAVPVAAMALVWTLYANVASAGDFAPWPFVPLANPLDIGQACVFAGLALWLARMRRAAGDASLSVSTDALGVVAAALLLVWVTCSTLRTVHHVADVPWSLSLLWASRLVQTALSIVWTLAALAAMVVGNRRGYRIAWLAGAALLGIVVAKLFFVDLSQAGGVERIVSFIGVGALLLVIGYVAPVPPRREAR